MTVFDYVFLSVLGLSAALGLWRGIVGEILGLAAWALALIAAARYADLASASLASAIADPRWRMVAAFTMILVSILLVVSLIRVLLRRLLRAAGLGSTDRFFGAAFGLLRGLMIAIAVVWIGGLLGMSREPWWEQALFAPPLEKAVNIAQSWLPDADTLTDNIPFK